jgi:hypothetical protein
VAPQQPYNLVGLANGSNLSLAWWNNYDGGAPTSIVLDVSGSATATLPLGLTDSFSFSGVPDGTYTLRVRAVNSAGQSSPSNPLTLAFPSTCSGAPFPPASFLAYSVGNTAYAIWNPYPVGPAPTSSVLIVTGGFTGTFQTTGRGLSGAVAPGTYNLSVTASNACGTSAATPVQSITIP